VAGFCGVAAAIRRGVQYRSAAASWTRLKGVKLTVWQSAAGRAAALAPAPGTAPTPTAMPPARTAADSSTLNLVMVLLGQQRSR
jgi:hypothetical protein